MLGDYGIELLDGECVQALMETRRGFSSDIDRFRSGLILTDRRLINVTRNNRERSAWAASIADVKFVQMQHTVRNGWLFLLAILLIPMLVGLYLFWLWWRSGMTVIRTRLEGVTVSASFARSARSGAQKFVKEFFVMKDQIERVR